MKINARLAVDLPPKLKVEVKNLDPINTGKINVKEYESAFTPIYFFEFHYPK